MKRGNSCAELVPCRNNGEGAGGGPGGGEGGVRLQVVSTSLDVTSDRGGSSQAFHLKAKFCF